MVIEETQEERDPSKKAQEVMEEKISSEDIAKIYESTLKDFEEGEVVRGTVVAVENDFVLVDVGFKSEGLISLSEFSSPKDIKIGDQFDVLIEEAEDQEGLIVLSKLKADKIRNWTKIQRLYENNEPVEGKIVKKVKGGLKVDIGLDAFLPASQVARRPPVDLDKYVGQILIFRIIKLTKKRRNVVLSRRALLEEEEKKKKKVLFENLREGQTIHGVVKNITDFGAFIDLGGVDGLLHITDISWGRIKHPSEVLNVGDKIEVMVLSINKEEEKISLGLKQKTPNPWALAETKYPIGSTVKGKVVNMTDYGAFVQLEEGLEGMVHVSEMSWSKKVKHPSEVVRVGDEIEVRVLSINPQEEKLSLGIKQVEGNIWDDLETKYPVGSTVKGVVKTMTDYGAFIQLEEGVDGLLHVSDMSWTKRVSHPSEMLKKGQEVEVKILALDTKEGRLSLGLKQLEPDPWPHIMESIKKGDNLKAVISKLVTFGAFARLDNDVEGLIHISELALDRVAKPEDVVKVGDEVWAKVISIDKKSKKIGLSIKQYLREQTEGFETTKDHASVDN